MNLPSLSNTTGTLLGTLAGAAVASTLPNIPLIVSTAAALGMTPVGLAGIAAIGATALVNYAVTHYAEVANLNALAKDWWPQIVQTYPANKNGQNASPAASANNLNQQG